MCIKTGSHKVSTGAAAVLTGYARESQRPLEKRAVFAMTTLSGFLRAAICWVMISDSLPWLRPSLLGLAAGVVHVHHCEKGEETDSQGWFEERTWVGRVGRWHGGGGGGISVSTVLHERQPILR